jgi:O-antigen biosynthesis protein WbqV
MLPKWRDPDVAARVLGREPRRLDAELIERYAALRRFLVTGAGGTLGGELCRQLLDLRCGRLVALDHSDHALIDLLDSAPRNSGVQEVLCDIRDRARLSSVVQQARPSTVIHAAALKHVHMGDRHPSECVLSNLVGVRNAFEAALEAKAETFVFVSTDKAAAPTGVMGACKRLAELYLEHRRRELVGTPGAPRILTVRFGNVFGSQGSVVEVFGRQIERGEPLTITHGDMLRYFMTLSEAVHLILSVAAAHVADEDGGGAYVLDMGHPVRIIDVARRMMDEAGVDLPITTCGIREGEKIEEELYDAHEALSPVGVPGVLRIAPLEHAGTISSQAVEELERAARQAGEAYVRHRLFDVLAEALNEPSVAATAA